MTTRRYRIHHLTSYLYDDVLEACYNRGLLRPRNTEHQRVLSSQVQVSPQPDLLSEHQDYFGNHSVYLETRTPATQLVVSAESVVEVSWPTPDLDVLNRWTVAEAAAACAATDPLDLADFGLPSPMVCIDQSVREYAAAVLRPGTGLGDALVGLNAAIAADFAYAKGVTSVRTTLTELLELRQGVCQDFAQLAIGCLRAVGLPARYVSGYLETAPPPGRDKLRGADATHAWASVLTPAGWVDLDPTNDQFVDSAYIVTAWGRDFSDVSPLRGVVFTEAAHSTLSVEVDVEPVDVPEIHHRSPRPTPAP
jgi:transglutaminase-like putative cysteine protease